MVVERLLYFIISGVLLLFVGVAWYMIKQMQQNQKDWRVSVDSKLDKMIDELKNIGMINISQDEKLKSMDKTLSTHERRLNAHSERLKEISNKQASCRNYKSE